MYLRLEEGITLGFWIERQLLRDTECLLLTRSGANKLDLRNIEHISVLEFNECDNMKKVVRTSMDDNGCVLSPIERASDAFQA